MRKGKRGGRGGGVEGVVGMLYSYCLKKLTRSTLHACPAELDRVETWRNGFNTV